MSERAAELTVLPISLVITVLNEIGGIDAFRESVESLTSTPAEIVIVDGGSTDGTREYLMAWSEASTGVRVIDRSGASISTGRNVAIEHASHEFIAVTDAGTTLSPEWLMHLYESLREGHDVASGFFRPGEGRWFEQVLGTVILPDLREIDPSGILPSSRSVAFTRTAWKVAGGYPEWLDYCEDLVFDLTLRNENFSFSFVPDAVVTWDARPSLGAFANQYFRYARGDGKAGLWQKRHFARYTAYLVGVVGLMAAASFPIILPAVMVGFTGYLSKYWRRVWRSRAALGGRLLVAMALVPVIVVVGDVAKMFGYPVGLMWKAKNPA